MSLNKIAVSILLGIATIGTPILASAPAMAAEAMTMTAPAGLKVSDWTPTSVGLKWTAVAGAPQYRIQFSKTPDMKNAEYARSIGNSPSADIRGLTPGVKYYFKIRVITTGGVDLSPYSQASVSVTTKLKPVLPAVKYPLSVATYNIHCANCNADPSNSWINRRASVVAAIKSKMPDVIGLQEASQAWLKDEKGNQINLSQFEDLQNRLNAAGANYQVTNPNRNNCEKSTTPSNCVYKDQGSSLDAKIFYNKSTVTLLNQGSSLLPNMVGATGTRYVSWALLRQNSTGQEFFFADAHLQPGSGNNAYSDARKAQAQKMTEVIKAKNTTNAAVIIAGDMNSSKWATPANDPYNVFTQAGYVDPIGGTANTSLSSGYATAEKMTNARYNSYSGFFRQLGSTSVAGPFALGSHIDYIFTSKMRVTEWEQVLNVDSTGIFQGIIPSDHNMIYAKVELPPASITAK